MRKVYLISLIVATLVLAGCSPQVKATPTATTMPSPVPTTVSTNPTQAILSYDSGCTAISKEPTPGPTQASLIPPVSDTDWVKGPANAKITIIEYSDFQ